MLNYVVIIIFEWFSIELFLVHTLELPWPDFLIFSQYNQAPTKFSELQIQSYLKTVAFRREIDEVQKSAIGRGVGGVQTSRIASEANREFIFSSSFTGDKQ